MPLLLSGGRNSPAVRRLLSEHGLNAAEIRGSGAGGRITVDDVLDHVAKQRAAASPQRARAAGATQSTPAGRRVPHTSMRKRIAERMVESLLHTAPHVTTIFEVDLSAVLAHRARHQARTSSSAARRSR